MRYNIDLLKGIHPGKIIDRDLKRRSISQREFAKQINEHSQTLNAIITGRRNITTEMAIKIENMFGYDEGFLLILQVLYNIAKYKEDSRKKRKAPNVRSILFWDTDFKTIDWEKNKYAVIKRVLERGNDKEIEEIAKYYNIEIDELYKTKNIY
ncbi:MAG: HigA family addiction module antidote protein [Muribaculaceae bacterium]|nr:HigA family addiction module antidote protein [Muribaculaceae bacterium]